MGGQNQHLGDLHVGRGVGSIDSHIGHIVGCERFDTLINLGSPFGVAVEARVAEICFDKSGLEIRHTDGRVRHIDAQTVAEGFHRCFCGTIDVAAGVGRVACQRADVDDVASVALDHAGHDESRHRQQTLDVGVDHRLPIVETTLIFGFQTECQPRIVHQNIDFAPIVGQSAHEFLGFFTVSHVESQREHFTSLFRQIFSDFGESMFVSSRQNQFVAVGSEFLCASESDATCRTCNQYNFLHIFSILVYTFCKISDFFRNMPSLHRIFRTFAGKF